MSYFAVSKYFDRIVIREDRAKGGTFEFYEYFDSKEEAHAFILDRAFKAKLTAEQELKNAKLRLRRCEKKYPITFVVSSHD